MAFNYPWTNLHELNLNWILSQIRQLTKQVSKFVNLTASAHSVPYGSDPTVDVTGGTGNDPYNLDFGIPESASSAVNTVNGQSGDVVLTASDIGLGNVDNVQQYSATNPPPYPVTSVNGQTGDVTVAGAVDSVNGQTGTVVLGSKVTAPITASSSDITLNQAYMVEIGNLVSYTFEFVTATAINYNLILGMKPAQTGSIIGHIGGGYLCSSTGITYPVKISNTGSLSYASLGSLPAGTYSGCVTYITAS